MYSLLSRGKDAEAFGYKEPNKKQKKKLEKKSGRQRGEGKDIWGLRRECLLCEELWKLGNIADLAMYVKEICDALLLLQSLSTTHSANTQPNSDFSLAKLLQVTMADYVSHAKVHAPPEAPIYPIDWLVKRNMTIIQKFQQMPPTFSMQCKSIPAWRTQIIKGINYWESIRLITLHVDE